MRIRRIIILAALVFAWIGAASAESASVTAAKAILNPTQGNTVTGIVTFTQEANGVKVIAELTGLTPGKHGFHIHEFGDCSSADATSAGPHFNPYNLPHAGPTDKMRHEGDMGNIDADASGKAYYEYLDKHLSFHGVGSILGRSVVVHEQTDDLHTSPSGASGLRIACGIIGVAK